MVNAMMVPWFPGCCSSLHVCHGSILLIAASTSSVTLPAPIDTPVDMLPLAGFGLLLTGAAERLGELATACTTT